MSYLTAELKAVAILIVIPLFLFSPSAPPAHAQSDDAPSAFERLPQFAKFRQLGVEQGLSHGTAWHLMKDRRGYVWIATFDGLNRYDGYEVTVYKHDPDDPHSLATSSLKHVFEDNAGLIWISTKNLKKSNLNYHVSNRLLDLKYHHFFPNSLFLDILYR